jgi:anti-sigma factor RsiW
VSDHTDIREEELHAFIDGELDDARRSKIDEANARDPALAARIAAFRSDKARIAGVYGALGNSPLPEKWLTRIERHAPSGDRRPLMPALAALAASLLLLVVGSAVITSAPRTRENSIVADALAARENTLRPGSIVAFQGAKLNAASGILAKTLAMRVSAPDLSGMGYSLAALQIYPDTPNGTSVELVYRGPRGADFTLFVRHSAGEARFDVFEREGVRVCLWQDDVVATVMAGRMSAAEMQRLASLAYNGLSG